MSTTDIQEAPDSAAVKPVTDITTMLLPVAGKFLLLPGVSVAEIIHYSYPERPEDAPPWYYGTVEWRKLSVPLVSFEILNGEEMPRGGSNKHIAVLNNTGVSDEVPFLAIMIQGIPRLLRANEKAVNDTDENIALARAELAAVSVAGWDEPVYIPDVSVLEKAIALYLRQR